MKAILFFLLYYSLFYYILFYLYLQQKSTIKQTKLKWVFGWLFAPVLLDGQSRRFHLCLQVLTGQVTSPPAPPLHCCHWSADDLPSAPPHAFPACLRRSLSQQRTRSQPEQHHLFCHKGASVFFNVARLNLNRRLGKMGKKWCRNPPDGCRAKAFRTSTLHVHTRNVSSAHFYLWKCSSYKMSR